MIVSAIAQQADVKVVWGNFRTASTNGKQINMPMLPLEDDKVEAYALGFAVHETGHLVGSDFGVFANSKCQGIRRSILNILEDVRIEAERMRTLPGARQWLESLHVALVEDGLLSPSTADIELPDKFTKYLLHSVYYEVLRYPALKDLAATSRALLQQELPADLFDQVEAISLNVVHAKSTQDAWVLTEQLMDLLQKRAQQSQTQDEDNSESGDDDDDSEEQENSDPQSGPKEQGDDQGNPSDDQDTQSQSNDDGASPDESDKPSDSSQVDAKDDESQNTNDSNTQQVNASNQQAADENSANFDQAGNTSNGADEDGAETSSVEPQSNPQSLRDVADALQEILDASETQSGKDKAEMIVQGLEEALEPESDSKRCKSPVMSAPEVAVMQHRADGSAIISQVRTQSMALRARLNEFVQVNSRRRSSSARSGSRMVRDAASRIAMNDFRVFSVQRSQVKVVDTAIVLLVDTSYSMKDPANRGSTETQLDVAKKSSVALASALEQIKGTQLSVIGFGDSTITTVMQFGEGIRQAAGRIATFRAAGGTPLTEGLMVSHSALLKCNALRRIVMVITDGEPDDEDTARELVKFGQKHDIEHMGVGIKMTTDHLFPVNCLVTEVQELPRAVIGMVQQALFDTRLAA